MHVWAPILLRTLALALLAAGGLYFALLVKGSFVLRRLTRVSRPDYSLPLLKSRLTPAVNFIFAPPDSSAANRELARHLLGLTFANFEVVVALNDPTEADLKAWSDQFYMQFTERPITGPCPMGKIRRVLEARPPARLIVLDVAPSAEPLVWNAALNAAQSPMIAVIEADCDFDPRVLRNMIHPMVDDRERVVAVCACAPGLAGNSLPQQMAALGYLQSWMTRAAAFSDWNWILPPAGGALLANREALLETGGFRAGLLQLILDLHARLREAKTPYRILFVPNAGAHWRTPQTISEIQAAETKTRREAILCAGAADLPIWLRAWLAATQVLWPALESAAYILTALALLAGWIDWQIGALMLLTTVGIGMVTSMSAVSLCEVADAVPLDPARLSRLMLAAIVENFGIRQARNLRLLLG